MASNDRVPGVERAIFKAAVYAILAASIGAIALAACTLKAQFNGPASLIPAILFSRDHVGYALATGAASIFTLAIISRRG